MTIQSVTIAQLDAVTHADSGDVFVINVLGDTSTRKIKFEDLANSFDGFSSPLLEAGDLIYRDEYNVTNRLPIGSTGQHLIVGEMCLPEWQTYNVNLQYVVRPLDGILSCDKGADAFIPAVDALNGWAGLMIPRDKAKLDTIEFYANANVNSNWNERDENSWSYIQNKPVFLGGPGVTVSPQLAPQENVISFNLALAGGDDGLEFVGINPSKLSISTASESKLGGVKVGNGLTVTTDGTLSVDIAEVLTYRGTVDLTNPFIPPPPAPGTGDVWINTGLGSSAVSWAPGLPGGTAVDPGDLITWNGSEWRLVPTGGQGYWNRVGTTIQPLNSGDHISTQGKIIGGSFQALNGPITGIVAENLIPFHFEQYSALPNPVLVSGAVVHAQDTGRLYYAHAGSWVELANMGDVIGTNLATQYSPNFVTITSDTGTDALVNGVTNAMAGVMTPVMKEKLDDLERYWDRGVGGVLTPKTPNDNIETTGTVTATNVFASWVNTTLVTAGVGGNRIPFYYANSNEFPDPGTYPGTIALDYAQGKIYFAWNGTWVELAEVDNVPPTDLGAIYGIETVTITSSTGDDVEVVNATLSSAGVMSAEDKNLTLNSLQKDIQSSLPLLP